MANENQMHENSSHEEESDGDEIGVAHHLLDIRHQGNIWENKSPGKSSSSSVELVGHQKNLTNNIEDSELSIISFYQPKFYELYKTYAQEIAVDINQHLMTICLG